MTPSITLHQIPGSPNNIKIRIALNYKGLPWRSVPLALEGTFPFDRASIVEVSRQPFTPVLQHGETVIFDSGSILRYLEANFPDTKPIFSTDYDTMRAIENWEFTCRSQIGPAVAAVFGQIFAPEPDLAACEDASRKIHERTEKIEEALAETPYLLGSELTAADIVIAPFLNLGMLEASPDEGQVYAFFREHFDLGEGRDSVRAWVRRVMELATEPTPA